MRRYVAFEKERDYWVPLLQLLADMPGHQGKRTTVLREFGGRYRDFITANQREELATGEVARWSKRVEWARNLLCRWGLVDAPARGVWHITDQGIQWLQEHPDETHIDLRWQAPGSVSDRATLGGEREASSGNPGSRSFTVGGQQFTLSAEQVLSIARQFLDKGLPREAQRYNTWVVMVDGNALGLKWLFGEVTGLTQTEFTTYSARRVFSRLGLEILQLTEKPKPAKPVAVARSTDRDEERRWLDALRAEVTAIRELLRGRGERPTDDSLCDMVQFCYTLGLYREGWELFALVDKMRTNGWQYERTRKLAKVCELKGDHER